MGAPRPPLDLSRPRSVGDLLSLAFTLFGRHSGLFLSVTLLVVAPIVIAVDGVWGRALDGGPKALDHATAATTTMSLVGALVIPPLVTGMHAVIVREMGRGRVLDVRAALRDAAPRFPAAIGAVTLFSICVGVGFVLLVIPGIWIAIRLYFAAQAAVLERLGPIAALERSSALVKGRWWEAFGALLASGIFFGAAGAVAQALLRFVHEGVAYVTLLVLVRALTLSLTALFGTLLFFSLRAREREAKALAPARVG